MYVHKILIKYTGMKNFIDFHDFLKLEQNDIQNLIKQT